MPRKPSERPAQTEIRAGLKQLGAWAYLAAGPEYHEAGMAVLGSAGKLTRVAYLEMMLDMETRFPGRGWKEQLDELEVFYFKHGLAIKEFPRSRQMIGEIGKFVDSGNRKE